MDVYADSEHNDSGVHTHLLRRGASLEYSSMIEDYSIRNKDTFEAVGATPSFMPSITRNVPQCSITTSESNSTAVCTSVNKVAIPTYQHKTT